MKHVYSDGGRAAAGFKGKTGDCGVRAVAIATGRPYAEVYDAINEASTREHPGARRSKRAGRSSAGTGVWMATMKRYMEALGWRWHPTMAIGSGCKVHLRADELPPGRIIVRLSRHYAAVIDGELHDTYDDSRDGTRCVYGYWTAA